MVQKPISIYVIGPSSTGKTTLCTAIAMKLGLTKDTYVTEIARSVMKEKGYSRDTIGQLQMQEDIMEAYFTKEKELEQKKNGIRLFDRSAIDPIAYAILTSTDEEEAATRQQHLVQIPSFQQALSRYRSFNCIVILLGPIPEWVVDDGVRTLERQEKCSEIFRKLLVDLQIPYHEFGEESKFLPERVLRLMGLAWL